MTDICSPSKHPEQKQLAPDAGGSELAGSKRFITIIFIVMFLLWFAWFLMSFNDPYRMNHPNQQPELDILCLELPLPAGNHAVFATITLISDCNLHRKYSSPLQSSPRRIIFLNPGTTLLSLSSSISFTSSLVAFVFSI